MGEVAPDDQRGHHGPAVLVTYCRLGVTLAAMGIGAVLALRGDSAGIGLLGACVGYWLGSPTDRRLDR
jgi:hypothetical protein